MLANEFYSEPVLPSSGLMALFPHYPPTYAYYHNVEAIASKHFYFRGPNG